MAEQITIEDMDSFIKALQYSQTLVNTANSGADLAFDFLRSYDYYGSVRMSVAADTKITANGIALSGYTASQFFEYDETSMINYFYPLNTNILGIVRLSPIGSITDNSLLTKEALEELSVAKDGSIHAEHMKYDSGLVFNSATDDDNTVFPISVFDQMFYKIGDTIDVGDATWDVKMSLTNGVIIKRKDSSMFEFTNVTIDGGLLSSDIAFTSLLEGKEEILKHVIREDGIINSNAVIPEPVDELTNIFTLRKLDRQDFKKYGDEIELHLEDVFTDAELKAKVDAFVELSGSALIYGGEDAYLTEDQSKMLVEYLFRKFTSISKSSIQL